MQDRELTLRTCSLITSTRNQQIVQARKLGQRIHRQRQGQFLVEGLELLRMALDAKVYPSRVFYCGEHVRKDQFMGTAATVLLTRFRQTDAIMMPVSASVMHALSQRDIPQGIVATFALLECGCSTLLSLTGHELIVVLDRFQDPGSMGTLIRTADAAGAAAVVLIEPCADPFDPKAVRGSMGSLFNIPLTRTSDVPTLFTDLGRKGLHPIGMSARAGAAQANMFAGQGVMKGGVTLVLGNEARRLSKDVDAHMGQWVCLPIVGKAESLNVAVAGGVLMYAWLRENMASNSDSPLPGYSSKVG